MKKTMLNAPATAIITTIYERRAVRKYKTKPVEKILIEKILDAGRMAPSAINRQPWKFYILTNRKTIDSFSKEIAKAASKLMLKTGIKNVLKNMVHLLRFTHLDDLLKFTGSVFHGAPVVIFITSPRNNEWASPDVGKCCSLNDKLSSLQYLENCLH